MLRRRFFTKVSSLLAFLGMGAISRPAAAESTEPIPEMVWLHANEEVQDHHPGVPGSGTRQTIEILEGIYGDLHFSARITHHHPVCGPYYLFDVKVSSSTGEDSNPSDNREAGSWASDLKEARDRAELAIKLLLDIVRVENAIGSDRWPSLRLLSSR